MTAQPAGPAHGPDTGSYEVIHLGGHAAAVVVPLADFMRRAYREPDRHHYHAHRRRVGPVGVLAR